MTLTQVVILLTFALLCLYTGYAHTFGQRAISPTIRDMAWRFNTVPLVAGVLMGHWFMPNSIAFSHRVGGVLPIIIVVALLDISWNTAENGRRAAFRWPGIWVVVGIVSGALLWSQA